ncbi:hypothetical protein [Streptomyces sp. NBC_00057]|uniref:hypothetical protein n=1 Tax=Streptomyces sp. NBC_00057 TaxID=2975634 RepID=UPI00324C2C13
MTSPMIKASAPSGSGKQSYQSPPTSAAAGAGDIARGEGEGGVVGQRREQGTLQAFHIVETEQW